MKQETLELIKRILLLSIAPIGIGFATGFVLIENVCAGYEKCKPTITSPIATELATTSSPSATMIPTVSSASASPTLTESPTLPIKVTIPYEVVKESGVGVTPTIAVQEVPSTGRGGVK